MAAHEQSVGATDEWYTPRHVFDAMGVVFDMDVASPGEDVVPWVPAAHHITQNSLNAHWAGFVWMNPPFGKRNGMEPWLAKFFDHGNGVALTPDRTSAPWWQRWAPHADGILFVRRKIRFLRPDGSEGKAPGTGTCLWAAGWRGKAALRDAARAGLGLLLTAANPATASQSPPPRAGG